MVRRKRKFVIRILNYKPVWSKQRKTPLEFGTEFAWQNKLGWTTEAEIEQIRACADLCRKSHAAGYWLGTTYEERRKASSSKTLPTGGVLNWGTFADRIEAYLCAQTANQDRFQEELHRIPEHVQDVAGCCDVHKDLILARRKCFDRRIE